MSQRIHRVLPFPTNPVLRRRAGSPAWIELMPTDTIRLQSNIKLALRTWTAAPFLVNTGQLLRSLRPAALSNPTPILAQETESTCQLAGSIAPKAGRCLTEAKANEGERSRISFAPRPDG